MTIGALLGALEGSKPDVAAVTFPVGNETHTILLRGKELERLESALRIFLQRS